MDRVHLKKAIPHGEGETLFWTPSFVVDKADSAFIVCANGHTGSLRDHQILDTGEVNPSVVCIDGCDWHVWIQLDDWSTR